ncbi:hypothetical protein PHYSODRAFT_343164 [Phytophthora sojae]|uniref:Uncharacterized protein n=1 Tax=Phytophthora sojae (strain P6497) TaxID=1094619 RepID=G5AIU3_PHYSP|nr:hypothetical protein PHYSODRAFT_343164 [Phytophthora sojae]EGZ04556.1 hypothetical protein PHYSODRAFT_343164 [Phytophthora sojae]|eukprot:XP_009539994.1 hypothetical protein PHYSODRAFT_343164 [Phytophthora sojae]
MTKRSEQCSPGQQPEIKVISPKVDKFLTLAPHTTQNRTGVFLTGSKLELQQQSLIPRTIVKTTAWSVVAEYFRLFRYALTAYVPMSERR